MSDHSRRGQRDRWIQLCVCVHACVCVCVCTVCVSVSRLTIFSASSLKSLSPLADLIREPQTQTSLAGIRDSRLRGQIADRTAKRAPSISSALALTVGLDSAPEMTPLRNFRRLPALRFGDPVFSL